ncbi:MAG: hypothetical protein PVSMB1_16600 [Gemmatimonadaceae bacterium]
MNKKGRSVLGGRHGAVWVFALVVVACGGPARLPELRQWTDDLAFRISSDPMPPRAREKILYRVIVTDRKSGEPVQKGEGRIFATSRDGANVWDALERGPEIGTYYGSMRFVTAGDWAVAIQFRRDSVQRLERIDWMQDVHSARSQ